MSPTELPSMSVAPAPRPTTTSAPDAYERLTRPAAALVGVLLSPAPADNHRPLPYERCSGIARLSTATGCAEARVWRAAINNRARGYDEDVIRWLPRVSSSMRALAAERHQLRRAHQPEENAAALLGGALELDETGTALLELEERRSPPRREPCDQLAEMGLMTDNRHSGVRGLSPSPGNEFVGRALGSQGIDLGANLDVVRAAEDRRRFHRPRQRARRNQIRNDGARQSLGDAAHPAAPGGGQRAKIVRLASGHAFITVHGDSVSDD